MFFQKKVLETPLIELSHIFVIFKFSSRRNFSFFPMIYCYFHHCPCNPTWIRKSALKEVYTLMRLPAFLYVDRTILNSQSSKPYFVKAINQHALEWLKVLFKYAKVKNKPIFLAHCFSSGCS